MSKTSEEIRQGYRDRLILPEEFKEEVIFYTKSGLELAKNYIRVVIGDRGPYVEFDNEMMIYQNIHIPKDQEWRTNNALCFYLEYRSNDDCNVKIYKQKKPVKYADYKIGLWYVSPFDMFSDKCSELIRK